MGMVYREADLTERRHVAVPVAILRQIREVLRGERGKPLTRGGFLSQLARQPHRGNAPARDLGELGEEGPQLGFDFRQSLLL